MLQIMYVMTKRNTQDKTKKNGEGVFQKKADTERARYQKQDNKGEWRARAKQKKGTVRY